MGFVVLKLNFLNSTEDKRCYFWTHDGDETAVCC